jgi:hypothetical protein
LDCTLALNDRDIDRVAAWSLENPRNCQRLLTTSSNADLPRHTESDQTRRIRTAIYGVTRMLEKTDMPPRQCARLEELGSSLERCPMRDVKSDWKRWSHAERVSAVALVAAFIICGSSIFSVLAGGSGATQGTTTVVKSSTPGFHGIRH